MKGAFPGHNRLYRNLGGYHFEDVTDALASAPYHADSFTAVFADFTGDGRPDIYQANDHRPDRFYRNQGGGALHATRATLTGLTRAGNSMGVATTVGPDGGLQLFVTNITDPERPLRQQPRQHLHDVQRRTPSGHPLPQRRRAVRASSTPPGAGAPRSWT